MGAEILDLDECLPGRRPYPHSLPAILMRAREAVMARVRPTLRAYDVTEPQWRVLRTLSSLEEVEVTQLAEMVFLLPSSLSRILRDLGARDLIQRRTSDSDLRRGLVSISDKGMQLIDAATPHANGVNAEIEQLFGSKRMAELRRLLAELEQSLGHVQPSE
jgi:homoprotocatechuate degradation regulator HpaR